MLTIAQALNMAGKVGVVTAPPVRGASHALFLSVPSHHCREARRIGLNLQGSCITPPTPPFARGGKEIAREVVSVRTIKPRVSKPSLQFGKHPLARAVVPKRKKPRFS